jgi:L-threonylcarbamoyladenylate synthase
MSSLRHPARLFRGTPHNVARLAGALARGELVAVPTETVYGLAADALNPRACREIFRAKGRPHADPLIVHIHAWAQLAELAHPNDAARRLAEAFWPGPLTLVLNKKSSVPDIVTAGRSSVAVRMPRHPLLRRLLKKCACPLAAPSANPFGYVSPTTAEHVRAGLGKKIRYILDGGAAHIGLESTIVDVRNPRRPRLLRPGAITREQLERVLGQRVGATPKTKPTGSGAQLAPGQLKRHYSPRATVILHETISSSDYLSGRPGDAWLLLTKPAKVPPADVAWLDPRGDLRGVARHLFHQLRELDAAGYRTIHAELARGGGLAEAINDRLRRAAARG